MFSIEVIKQLFAPGSLESVWDGNRLTRTVSLVAACTGMRLGELLALRGEDVHDDHIHVAHSYHSKWGLAATKTRTERDVPVPVVYSEVRDLTD